tara:strand:+ start:79 stop:540 length:462 start_codon:yes stop_codon:yes gene_type:complete
VVKTILIPFDAQGTSNPCLPVSLKLGQRLESHLVVMHVKSDPKETISLFGEGMSVNGTENIINVGEREADGLLKKAQKSFNSITVQLKNKIASAPIKRGSSAWWLQVIGREDDKVATYGQTSDLIVVSKANKESDLSISEVLNAAIFGTRMFP